MKIKNNGKTNKIRIIGGSLRGSIIQFPVLTGLRPSSDRTRETLFNWLIPYIQGSHCLDLFAGSGALGFEALSRGASAITMIDQAQSAVQHLQHYKTKFAQIKTNAEIKLIHTDAQKFITVNTIDYDIIFLDPPFNKNLLIPFLKQILAKKLSPTRSLLIYFEAEKNLELVDVMLEYDHTSIIRHKKTQEVQYGLIEIRRIQPTTI